MAGYTQVSFQGGGGTAGAATAASCMPLSTTSRLRHGQAGPRIKPLQQRLRLLGHDVPFLHAIQRVARRQLQRGRGRATWKHGVGASGVWSVERA